MVFLSTSKTFGYREGSMGKKTLHGTITAAVPLDIVRDTPAAVST
jgi:hypothetical protein